MIKKVCLVHTFTNSFFEFFDWIRPNHQQVTSTSKSALESWRKMKTTTKTDIAIFGITDTGYLTDLKNTDQNTENQHWQKAL